MATDCRQALVIGNGRYTHVPTLKNPENDAYGMKKAVKNLKFETDYRTNLKLEDMKEATDEFIHDIDKGDTVFVYFAGHGLQYRNTNYLVGTDAPPLTEANFREYCLNAQHLLDAIAAKSPSTIIFILDCCRNNPLVRITDDADRSGFHRGLANMNLNTSAHRSVNTERTVRKIVVFPCQTDKTAKDSSKYNGYGPLAYHLIAQINRRLDFNSILRDVKSAIKHDTANELEQQKPHILDNGSSPIYLVNVVKHGYESGAESD